MSDKKEFLNPEEANGNIEKIMAHNKKLEKENESLRTELKDALTSLSEISEQVALQSTVSSPKTSVVKVGKQNYTLHGQRFIIPGLGNFTASELAKNQNALQLLVDRNSSALVKI